MTNRPIRLIFFCNAIKRVWNCFVLAKGQPYARLLARPGVSHLPNDTFAAFLVIREAYINRPGF